MSGDKPRPLSERKESFARKQASQGKGLFAGKQARETGPANRHGMPKLPPGQRQVPNWPVLDLGDKPQIARADWRLDVDGLVEHPLSLTWEQFMQLPQTDDTSDFHCVTARTALPCRSSTADRVA
jgi:DMSO/TMAO reductase YedYZ molybdopterin-dependent catalytic subunit